MPENKFYVTLDPDSSEAIEIASQCTHTPKSKVLRKLITDGLMLKDIRETSLFLTREHRSGDYENELGRLTEDLSKMLSQTDDEFNEKDFFTDENTYLIFSLTIFLLDRVLPNVMSELEL
jgi:hypothetical protein